MARQSPTHLADLNKLLDRVNNVLDAALSMKFAIEGVLMDDKKLQPSSILFNRYVAVWLLRMASGTDYVPEKNPLTLPLAAKPPLAFSCLPEYALQNLVDNFEFVMR
jgi:ubiquitin conjugation factor E4 B